MAETRIKASYRRHTRTDLYRLTGPFPIQSAMADTGTQAYLVRRGPSSTTYLDADVVTGWVGLAPATEAPYFGTRWVMQNNADGTWSFLNQGQHEHRLAGAVDTITLGREPPLAEMTRFATTRWLIYHDLTGFRLRPAMRATGWLGVQGDRIVLSQPNDVAGPWLYWGIVPLPSDPDEAERASLGEKT